MPSKKKKKPAAQTAAEPPVLHPVQLVERRESKVAGAGQGLFATQPFPAGDTCVHVRPACSVVFDAFAASVCAFCFGTDQTKSSTLSVDVKRGAGGFGIRLGAAVELPSAQFNAGVCACMHTCMYGIHMGCMCVQVCLFSA